MIRSKHIPLVMAVGITVLVVLAGVVSGLFLTKFLKYDSYDKQDFIDSSVYQAVFLTNDQIYFGRLKNIGNDHLILSDVYYVKINEDGAGQLIKLGAIEPHGPKDQMVINQNQVLFWENLKPDSPVIKTIQSMKQK